MKCNGSGLRVNVLIHFLFCYFLCYKLEHTLDGDLFSYLKCYFVVNVTTETFSPQLNRQMTLMDKYTKCEGEIVEDEDGRNSVPT